MLDFKPLSGAFGVEIYGLDFSRPLSAAEQRKVIDIFYENRLIIVRNQQLKIEDFLRFNKMFGYLEGYVNDNLTLKGHPEVGLLSNIIINGEPIVIFKGAAFWHTDSPYLDPPKSTTTQYGLQWPKDGSPTYFADMVQAYEALSEPMKKRIDNLTVRFEYGNRSDLKEGSSSAAEKLPDELKGKITIAYHPLVMRHPVTGRKALYGVSGGSFGIVGFPDDEAVTLLDELKAHATQAEFITIIDFKPGDLGAWDNLSTLHKGTAIEAATSSAEGRFCWNASPIGIAPLLQAV